MQSFPFKRVVIIGMTSSGKSTLARQLADTFHLNFIELDALYWGPDWTETPLDVFRARVDEATRQENWVLAGNYRHVRELTWSRAEAIIWLDYSLWTLFWRLTRRTLTRWWTQELLWGTNRETLLKHFKLWSEDSLYHWLFKAYWPHKREYPILFADPENAHLKVIQLKSPRETEEWIAAVSRRWEAENSRQEAGSSN